MARRNRVEWVILGLLVAAAAFLRGYGLAWDSGYLFHPDERQILLIASKLQVPANFFEFVSPASPLNPEFFAYGSFPIYLLRALTPFAPPTNIVGPWADDQLARWALFGRALSGLFDLGTLLLTYALGKRAYDGRVGLIAAACVAFTVLHVQLSHFYAVDTLLTFLILATLYCAFRVAQDAIHIQKTNSLLKNRWLLLCGVFFGLALATKITAFPLVVPIVYACCHARGDRVPFALSREYFRRQRRALQRPLALIGGVALVVFLVTQPYALIDWYSFGRDVIREAFVARGWLDYPYTRQYAGTIPFAYQIGQSAVWGMGLPLGVFVWGGGALFVIRWWRVRDWRDSFMLSFALVYFIAVGLQYTKYPRYLLPLLPVLYIIAAYAWLWLLGSRRVLAYGLFGIILFSALLYSVAFVRMYDREHPWLTASRWIYQNVAPGKTILVEQWDDALPTLIEFPDGARRGAEYTQTQFPVFEDDTDAKRAALAKVLARADVVILASPRAYGSLGKLPARYPLTTRYYEKLFGGEVGFEPAMTARRDPNWGPLVIRDNPLAGLPFDAARVNALLDMRGLQIWSWGGSDESFSVYDHPQPIVFVKTRQMDADEIEKRLAE